MPHILVRHKVDDCAKWKQSFDDSIDFRKAGGEKSYQIFQTIEDPNNLVLLFEWNNIANAKRFLESSELQEKMQQAGVSGKPEIFFLEKV